MSDEETDLELYSSEHPLQVMPKLANEFGIRECQSRRH